MSDSKWNDPANYRKMCEPHEQADAQAAIDAFIEDVRLARNKHRMMDVHVVIMANMKSPEGNESPVISRSHMGDTGKAQVMLAYALGNQEAEDAERARNVREKARKGR